MNTTLDSAIQPIEAIDLLNRQDFVDKLLQVALALSRNKKNACYAVNGTWGTGKSFVMDMFEKQAKDIGQEGTNLPRYLVFHYNCWEYDYYEEPLIAIVITMLDAIDKSVNLIDFATKTKVKEILKIVAKGFGKKIVTAFEEKTGVDVQEAMNIVSEGLQNAESASKNDYDPYADFKIALHQLRNEITALAENQTLIFVVDELDRCLPEYAIKVLERLHHLFNGIANVQVILSIDKKQLEHTVQQIYGPETDVNKYLAKFISFELELDTGSFTEQEKLEAKFEEYFSQFEYRFKETNTFDVEEFIKIIFDDIDIRSCISILDKCLTLHNILHEGNERDDYSILCIEIFLAVMSVLGLKKDVGAALINYKVKYVLPIEVRPAQYTLEKLSAKYDKWRYYSSSQADNETFYYVHGTDIWGMILSAYCIYLGVNKVSLHAFYSDLNYDGKQLTKYAAEYWSLLQIVN